MQRQIPCIILNKTLWTVAGGREGASSSTNPLRVSLLRSEHHHATTANRKKQEDQLDSTDSGLDGRLSSETPVLVFVSRRSKEVIEAPEPFAGFRAEDDSGGPERHQRTMLPSRCSSIGRLALRRASLQHLAVAPGPPLLRPSSSSGARDDDDDVLPPLDLSSLLRSSASAAGSGDGADAPGDGDDGDRAGDVTRPAPIHTTAPAEEPGDGDERRRSAHRERLRFRERLRYGGLPGGGPAGGAGASGGSDDGDPSSDVYRSILNHSSPAEPSGGGGAGAASGPDGDGDGSRRSAITALRETIGADDRAPLPGLKPPRKRRGGKGRRDTSQTWRERVAAKAGRTAGEGGDSADGAAGLDGASPGPGGTSAEGCAAAADDSTVLNGASPSGPSAAAREGDGDPSAAVPDFSAGPIMTQADGTSFCRSGGTAVLAAVTLVPPEGDVSTGAGGEEGGARRLFLDSTHREK